jgi:hypothetical protein
MPLSIAGWIENDILVPSTGSRPWFSKCVVVREGSV